MRIDRKETKRPGIIQITTLDERWYQRESDKKLVPSATWIAGYVPKGIGYMKWLAEHGWDESEALKNEAGERGSKVHQAIDRLLGGEIITHNALLINSNTGKEEEISVQEYEAVKSFSDWFDEAKPETIMRETALFNDEYNYAGTMDFKCRIAGEVWIIDFKTSQNIWLSHEAQISAYKHSPENIDGQRIGILQVGYNRNKAKFKFTEIEDKFKVFLAARLFWEDANKDVSPRQFELPEQLKLNLNHNSQTTEPQTKGKTK